MSNRSVYCQYLKREAPGLARPPLPGPLGQEIYDNISDQAWKKWLAHQTMLINENRLSPTDPEHRKYLEQQARAFLFEGKADEVAGYTPPEG